MSGEYPVEEKLNKAAECPKAPFTQFSEFAYKVSGRHPILRHLQQNKLNIRHEKAAH
jgi:hypothetical protein